MRSLSFILLLLLLPGSVSSQGDLQDSTGRFSLYLGINTFGPVCRMNRLMIENEFNVSTANWFTGGTIYHPHRDPAGFTAQLSWFQPKQLNRKTGVVLNYSYLRIITGYSSIAEWLTVRFSHFYLAFPVYEFMLSGDQEGINLRVAPVLMLNSGVETGTGTYPEKYVNVSPGFFSGAYLELWEKRSTCGSLGVQLVSGLPLKMGPFTAENWFGDSDDIPEAGYWFSHLDFIFSIGFNL